MGAFRSRIGLYYSRDNFNNMDSIPNNDEGKNANATRTSPFNWWQYPPDEVYFRISLFNITNTEEFLDGTDSKLRVEEVGPIVFKEKLTHTNVTFNKNGTLSYIARRSAEFVPEMNTFNLNASIVLPNLAVLGMASYLWDMPFITKFGFNLLLRSLQSKPIMTRTIYDVLWNLTDPILGVANTIIPSLVPTKNMGFITRMYDNSEDVVTVYLGPKFEYDKFFQIDKFGGSEYLPGYNPQECQDKVLNSSEGITYPQFLNKDSVLRFWKKTICKVYDLHYHDEQAKYGVTAYKYILRNDSFDRTYPSHSDCYISNPPLPNGLMDASKCHYDFPIAASFPHFLHSDESLQTVVDGLQPNESLHGSYAIVEPTLGVPVESVARSQSNLVIRKLSGFSDAVNRFSDMVIPMFWAEFGLYLNKGCSIGVSLYERPYLFYDEESFPKMFYTFPHYLENYYLGVVRDIKDDGVFNQVGLPWHIAAAVYCIVVLLPIAQVVIMVFLFLFGIYLIFTCLRKFKARRKKVHLVRNTVMHFEQDVELEESDKPLLITDE